MSRAPERDFDVLVVGAGMVGAATALMLARKRFRVAVVEREVLSRLKPPSAEDPFDLRVSAVSPASRALLARLGVWPALDPQRICDYREMRVWHEGGRAEMHFDSALLAAPDLGSIVENRLLQSALLQQLAALPGVELFGGSALQSIERDGDGLWLHTGRGERLGARLLVAADGRGSAVRELLGLPVWGGSYRQRAIVVNVDTERPHRHTAWQRFLHTGPLAFLPLANGQCSIVWSADDDRAEALMALDDAAFRAELGAAFEHRLGAITACSQRAAFDLGWHVAERWLDERVLLIGDAAHGVHPLAGQGVNLGFGDVDLLDRLLQPGQDPWQRRHLRRFERQRKSETFAASQLFSALKRIYGQSRPALSGLRDLGMSLVDREVMLKRWIITNAMRNLA
jgi:ubiquinone biosynthesis UbiH/UbiF/VisC/COQ6 family hydroxylase